MSTVAKLKLHAKITCKHVNKAVKNIELEIMKYLPVYLFSSKQFFFLIQTPYNINLRKQNSCIAKNKRFSIKSLHGSRKLMNKFVCFLVFFFSELSHKICVVLRRQYQRSVNNIFKEKIEILLRNLQEQYGQSSIIKALTIYI